MGIWVLCCDGIDADYWRIDVSLDKEERLR